MTAHRRFQLVRTLTAAGVLCLLAHGASAATINVPADHATIQAAIDAAFEGDVIEIGPGTYYENIDLLGKTITVRATAPIPEFTVIDGGGLAPVVTCDSGEGLLTIIEGLTIRNGDGGAGVGGGAHIEDSSPHFKRCRFDGNVSNTGGGAGVTRSSAQFTSCRFVGNTSIYAGGAMYLNHATPVIDSCEFLGNTGDEGTAIFNGFSTSIVTHSHFHGNDGETVIEDNGGEIEIANSLLHDNLTTQGVINVRGSVTVVNTTIVRHDDPVFYNAAYEGEYTVANSILWNLAEWEVHPFVDDDTTITYSIVRGGFAGDGNIDANPSFVDPANDDFHLAWDSPAIDAADDDALSAGNLFDLDGNTRRVNNYATIDTGVGGVTYLDMGPYETGSPVLFVNEFATGMNDGPTWDDAYVDLQDALETVDPAATTQIWLAAGTYKPDRGTGDRAATFALVDGVSLLGGFAGGETSPDQADHEANKVFLGGAIGASGTEDNSFHVVTGVDISAATRLEGLVIRKGNSVGAGSQRGSGVLLENASPSFVDCTIRANEGGTGSAIYATGGAPVFDRCRINLNDAAFCAAYFLAGRPVFRNTLIHGNAMENGAAVYLASCDDVDMTNCTVWGNHSGGWFAGIYNLGGTAEVANTISWGNTRVDENYGTPMAANLWKSSGTLRARFNTIGDYDGTGLEDAVANHGYDPKFVDADGPDDVYGTTDDDPRLMPNSRSIDSGDTDALPASALSFDGSARFLDDAGMTDTGRGGPPVVDRGAYEFDGTSCITDVDGDGETNFGDIIAVLAAWGACEGCDADVNFDGVVDFTDLVTVLANWGPCS